MTEQYHEGPVHWAFPRRGNPNSDKTIVAVERCPVGHLVATHYGPWAGSAAEATATMPPRVVRCYGALSKGTR